MPPTFPAPKNSNYTGAIVSVKAINSLKGRDRIVGIPIYGSQAIVQNGWGIGDLGVYFPAEVQFSDEYAHVNNLYRDNTKNADTTAVGYLEDNRRLKAIKLGGHRSDAMFMPLASLEYTGINIGQLTEGDIFDTVNGHEIVRKYEVRPLAEPRGTTQQRKATKKFKRVDAKFLPEHIDTDNYWRNQHRIQDDAEIIVTQKLHGSSVRIGNTLVRNKPTWLERVAKKFGVRIAETSYDNVYGSRKVVKDVNNPDQNHYYKSDIWTTYGKKLDGLVPQGFVVYGELIGWTPERSPIQKGYTYDAPDGDAALYVYRVAHVNPQGLITDLSWDQVKHFCTNNGLNHVPELWRGKHADFDVDAWMDENYSTLGYRNAVPLPAKTFDEGVCIRVDGELLPFLLKAKSPAFLRHESKILDEGQVDLESTGEQA